MSNFGQRLRELRGKRTGEEAILRLPNLVTVERYLSWESGTEEPSLDDQQLSYWRKKRAPAQYLHKRKSPKRGIDWASVDWSKRNFQIAVRMGVCPSAVRVRRNRLFPDQIKRRVVRDWLRVDWTRSNAAIGRLLGVSGEAVRQQRDQTGEARWQVQTQGPAF